MIIDSRNLPQKEILTADICIVGAGAAGIAIARAFNNSDIKIALLESGGLTFDHKTQFLYKGEITGRSFTPMEFTRRRQFGGSTVTWFGRCRPLDKDDFEQRAWIPGSGWPFSIKELNPYYEQAGDVLQIGENRYDASHWDKQEGFKGIDPSSPLETKIFHFSPPAHFGNSYGAELRRSTNISVYLYANAIQAQVANGGNQIKALQCATLQKTKFSVEAKIFILAMGGLETTRLLLTSNNVYINGIGNQNDILGRFFMDHVSFFDGSVLKIPDSFPKSFFRLDYSTAMKNIGMVRAIGLTSEYRQTNQLLNASAFFVKRPAYKMDDRFFSLEMKNFIQASEIIRHTTTPSLKLIGDIRRSISNAATLLPVLLKIITAKKSESLYGLHLQLECTPNPQSRLTLSDQKDALGINRLKLNWRLTQHDLESYQHFRRVIFNELGNLGFKSRKIEHGVDNEGWPVSLTPAKHPSGTTRMHKNERYGVVNEHCQVHGVHNLYIASGSVFPTSGMANPTLTIVAIALRIAKRIKHELRG
ncbi:MAG: hypothetical protein JNM55_08540 [Anaerolineales bacterium]|nr:hypothetical protein [Anaerolineales bacterium]